MMLIMLKHIQLHMMVIEHTVKIMKDHILRYGLKIIQKHIVQTLLKPIQKFGVKIIRMNILVHSIVTMQKYIQKFGLSYGLKIMQEKQTLLLTTTSYM